MTDPYAAAIEADQRWPIHSLRADWDRDGFAGAFADLTDVVDEFTITRELVGDLPPEVGILEGYATAQLTARLSGTWHERVVEATDPALGDARNHCPVPVPKDLTAGWEPITVVDSEAAVPVSGMLRPYAYRTVVTDPGNVQLKTPYSANIVSPGDVWTGVVEMRCDQPWTATVALFWFDYRGVFVDGTTPPLITDTAAGQPTLGRAIGRAPAGAACVCVFVRVNKPAGVTSTVDVTAVRLSPVDNPTLGYADGDTPGWHWDGPQYVSTSTRTPTVLPPDQGVATVLSPYRTDSPLRTSAVLSAPVECDTGFLTDTGRALTRKFTGQVARVELSSADRSAQIVAFDPANRLRTTITQPAIALDAVLLARYGPVSYAGRFNSQWVIDRVLRANGYFASPPCRDDALISVTGHGALIPERGYGGMPRDFFYGFSGPRWITTGHPYGMLYPIRGQLNRWWAEQPITAAQGDGFGFSLLIEARPGESTQPMFTSVVDDTPSADVSFRFGVDAFECPYAQLSVDGVAHRATHPAPLGAAGTWSFIGVHLAFSRYSMTVTWRRVTTSGVATDRVETLALPLRYHDWNPQTSVDVNSTRSFSNYQMWSSVLAPTGPWVGETWTSQADIDPGANQLTNIPELLSVDSKEVIRAVTAAELAQFGVSEGGRPWWRTRAVARTRGTPEVISADRNLSDLTTTADETTIRNEVSVRVTPSYLAWWDWGIEATDVAEFDCAPGTNIFELSVPSSVFDVGIGNGQNYAVGNDNWQTLAQLPSNRTRFIAMIVQRFQPNLVADFANVRTRFVRASPWLLLFIVANNNPYWIRFATQSGTNPDTTLADGEPALKIPWRMIMAGNEQSYSVTDQGSISRYGRSIYDMNSSGTAGVEQWRQWGPSMQGIAEGVVAQTAYPVPVLGTVTVPHDPRRTLNGDLALVDTAGLGVVRATISGVDTTFTNDDVGDHGGAVDVLSARPIGPPGLGILDDPELGIADNTLIMA